jgi:hypothetical protein
MGQRKNRETGEWIWRRAGVTSTADWPTAWPRHVEHFPEPPTRWIPEPGRVVTACLREGSLEILEWRNVAEAIQAATELFACPCGRGCAGRHVVVWTDAAGVHTRGLPATPPPLPLAEELARCYPSRRNGHLDTRPELWPTPSIMNMPLTGATCPQTMTSASR